MDLSKLSPTKLCCNCKAAPRPEGKSYCKPCAKEYRRQYFLKNRERTLKQNAEWYRNNKEERLKTCAEWREKNRDRINSVSSQWSAENKDRKLAAKLRRMRLLDERTLGFAEETKYRSAEIISSGLEVDHIVPIQGKEASGLNVPWNLQGLPLRDNRRKSNKFDDEKYQEWRASGESGPFIP